MNPQRHNSGDHMTTRQECSSTSSSSRSTSISHPVGPNLAPTVPIYNYRSTILYNKLEFEQGHSTNKYGMVIGDCDNDKLNELVIGTITGQLLVFKGSESTPCDTWKDLGTIACVLIGDILNYGINYIVTLSVEGYLYIFQMLNDVESEVQSISLNPVGGRHGANASSTSVPPLSNLRLPPTITDNEVYSGGAKLNPIHFQSLQANAMCALIVDFDNDGQNELIVALSDRVVRCYRVALFADDIKLIALHKWEFSDQIGSIALTTTWRGNPDQVEQDEYESFPNQKHILVTQFGGIFAKISCYGDNRDEEYAQTVEYYNSLVPIMRNPQISSELLCDIVSKDTNESLMAMATSDGLVILLSEQAVKWQQQFDYPILSIASHDLNHDGCDEIVICTWNGLVYIVDLEGQILTCQTFKPVSSFAVGHYDIDGTRTSCLAFATFSHTTVMLYNLSLDFVVDTRDTYLFEQIQKANLMDSLHQLVVKVNQKTTSEEEKAKVDSKLIRRLLYGLPK